jgi:hypothetical protein
MKEDLDSIGNQQSYDKPNQSSAENSQPALKYESNSKLQNKGEVDKNAIFQRRPQFRLQENCKKRYI